MSKARNIIAIGGGGFGANPGQGIIEEYILKQKHAFKFRETVTLLIFTKIF